jgi:lipopolysaccharide/colanic/teichoic acid biosynthesis glycosyltransferase
VIEPVSTWYNSCKRFFDVTVASILLVVTAPVMMVALILVKLTSRGPVIYSQVRLGWVGRPYTIYKIRSMQHNCEAATGPRWAVKHDPRVTRVGAVLRVTHLDELPQLVNVIRGEMSLVGPRPERPAIAAELRKTILFYDERITIRPGLTGLAQVQLPPDMDVDGVRRKLALDLYYIQNRTLSLDLRLLLATAAGVLGIPFRITQFLLQIPTLADVNPAYDPRGPVAPRVAIPTSSTPG